MRLFKSRFWKSVMPTALPFAAVISATALSLAACLGDFAPALTTMQLEPAGPPEFDAASLKAGRRSGPSRDSAETINWTLQME
jgi:hypothetical protein